MHKTALVKLSIFNHLSSIIHCAVTTVTLIKRMLPVVVHVFVRSSASFVIYYHLVFHTGGTHPSSADRLNFPQQLITLRLRATLQTTQHLALTTFLHMRTLTLLSIRFMVQVLARSSRSVKQPIILHLERLHLL